jgi:hypothetical protein
MSWQGLNTLLHLWLLPSSRVILLANDLPPLLSLACGQPLGRMALFVNGGTSTYLGLKDPNAQEKWGPNRPQGGPGLVGLVGLSLPLDLMSLWTLPPPFAPF